MTQDYKNTIRLPKTDFEMKANLPKIEPVILEKWEQADIYGQLRTKNKGNKKFILHDGPPYANGSLHIGHALNRILKDIIVKGYTMLGYDAPLVLGWDCHGLPIEWKIEETYKKQGLDKEVVTILEFRRECRDFAAYYIEIQKAETKRLGVIADYKNPYITMQYRSESLILKEISKFLLDGSLYLGKKPVLWSTVEQTVLAEAEVEYHDKISDAIYVGFEISSATDIDLIGAFILIWTTTPWTIPANQALSYSKDIEYSLYVLTNIENKHGIPKDTKVILAKSLVAKIFAELGVIEYIELKSALNLEKVRAKHPLFDLGYDYTSPAFLADFVSADTGTGIVHNAPSHGEDDFYLGLKHNLEIPNYVQDNGVFEDSVPIFAKEHIFKVNPLIIEKLQEAKTLFATTKITHSYPHSWRSKAPLIYKLTSQWFISMDKTKIRSKTLEAIEKEIEFFPKIAKNRLKAMVANRPDWCISRQRVWGVPIAIFVNKQTSEPLRDESIMNNIIQAFETQGSDVWFKGDVFRFLPQKYNQEEYKAVFDVVDVWFESGATHVFVLEEREELVKPADLYLEGSDQHRGWFQSSLLESIGTSGKTPFKKLLTHGFVLDSKGQKMSKSLGNGMIPQEIADKFGTDILRLWVATADYDEDVRISQDILAQQVDIYRKIRNTLRYLLGNLANFENNMQLPYEELEELEQWVLYKLVVLEKKVEKAFLETFDFRDLFSSLYNFASQDLSAFYFDIRKDSLYCDKVDNIKFRSSMTVLQILFNFLTKWLTPFISFTAEEAFSKNNTTKTSILLERFEETDPIWHNELLNQKWLVVQKLRKIVNTTLELKRVEKLIGSSLEASVIAVVSKQDYILIKNLNLAEICITSQFELYHNKDNTMKFQDYFVKEEDILVKVIKAKGDKCVRCWRIEQNLLNDLCKRCDDVISAL